MIDGVDRFEDNLRRVIEKGIVRKVPHVGLSGADTVFTGSFDWHSCVHAHWALHEIARLEKSGTHTSGKSRVRAASREKVSLRKRLTVKNIHKEVEFLKANPQFEKPYGRAWLVLLLESVPGDDFHEFRDWLGGDLLAWLDQSAFPEREDGFAGTHHSWLFCYFLLVLASRGRDAHAQRLRKLRRIKLLPVRDRLLDSVLAGAGRPSDFIDLPSLLATVDALQGVMPDRRLRDVLEQRKESLLAADIRITGHSQAHVPGRYVMQAWPFVFFDPATAERIMAKVWAEETCWKKSFAWVAHWVPQFMVMTRVLAGNVDECLTSQRRQ